MLRTSVAIVLLGVCSFVAAQTVTLADVKAKNAVQLSADELKQLMPGAKVVNLTNAGSTRNWENSPNWSVAPRPIPRDRQGDALVHRPETAPGAFRTRARTA